MSHLSVGLQIGRGDAIDAADGGNGSFAKGRGGEGRGGGGLDEWNRDWRLGECRCRFRSEGGELASDPRKVD